MATLKQTMKAARSALRKPTRISPDTKIRVGVDLGTAFSVVMVTDAAGTPLAGATTFADVVRDGIVWDFAGAQRVIRDLKRQVEGATGRSLSSAAVTIPPAVGKSDHRAHRYVVEGAGMDCTAVIDETTAANAVLGIRDGAVVDVGGGTTGVAILRDGEVIANIDEPTGGTHLSLVIAGALKIPFGEAEKRKVKTRGQEELLPLVQPTLEKISTIVRAAVTGHDVDVIHLVGGTAAFVGIAEIMAEITGIRTEVAPQPMLVTPLGVASFAEPIAKKGGH